MENLLLAYYRARKGKQNRDTVAHFSFELELNLVQLQFELDNNQYLPGAYRQFWIHERKPRLISAAPFRDRVIHHALMNVLEPLFEKRFYYHSYACRKNKGTHRAVDQYQSWAKRYPYVLKLDIKRYFPSIRHQDLMHQLARLIKDKRILSLLGLVIGHSPTDIKGVGLPIGNLTSQYLANLYLNEVDHWLSSQDSCKAYLRYVDDLMIFGDSKRELWQLKALLENELSILGLSLHDTKQQLMRTSERVDVLGYKVSLHRRWLRNDNGYRFQRKLKSLPNKVNAGEITPDKAIASVMSWKGHAKHGETKALVATIFESVLFH